MRPLLAWEIELLQKMADALPGDDAFASQISSARVRGEEDGWVDLDVPATRKPIARIDAFPINAWYRDTDEQVVFMLLHLDKDKQRLESIERYRADGEPILSLAPPIELVKVQLHLEMGASGSAGFDFERGWIVRGPQ